MRSINPLYGEFLAGHLAIADDTERLLALESTLQMPGTVARHVRVPKPEFLPPGPLATTRLDELLLQLGLATQEELIGRQPDDEDDRRRRGGGVFEEPPVGLSPAKLQRLFQYDFPFAGCRDHARPLLARCWSSAGTSISTLSPRGWKHEGLIFRHLLRLILLLDEMASIPPAESYSGGLGRSPGRTDCPVGSAAVKSIQTVPTKPWKLGGGDELTRQLRSLRERYPTGDPGLPRAVVV